MHQMTQTELGHEKYATYALAVTNFRTFCSTLSGFQDIVLFGFPH